MRIGILGYGSIGSRHGRNLTSLGHTTIVHDPAMTESLPKDVVIDKADAVVIASPTSEHSRDIALCRSKQKPCFAEKPIASEMKAKGDAHLSWPLMVGYNLRFHPCVMKAREWLQEGRIGKPLWASVVCGQFNERPEYLRDGVTLNWSHEIDLALHLLGSAEVLGAAITKEDDIADILLRHKVNGTHTTVHLDYVTRPEQRGFSITGPNGIIIGNIPARTLIYVDTEGNPKQVEQYQGSYDDDYKLEMACFAAKAAGAEEEFPGCTSQEAIEVLKVCMKAKKVAGI